MYMNELYMLPPLHPLLPSGTVQDKAEHCIKYYDRNLCHYHFHLPLTKCSNEMCAKEMACWNTCKQGKEWYTPIIFSYYIQFCSVMNILSIYNLTWAINQILLAQVKQAAIRHTIGALQHPSCGKSIACSTVFLGTNEIRIAKMFQKLDDQDGRNLEFVGLNF